MKLNFLLFVSLLSLFLPVTANAAQQIKIGLNDVIATVEKTFTAGSTVPAQVTDFTADFFQRTIIKKESREMRGDGVVSVKMPTASSPLMYRFQYYRPYQQEIVSDGNSLWIYHPENREVLLSDVSSLYKRRSSNPEITNSAVNFSRDRAVNFLEGLSRISKDFQINFASGMNDPAGNYVLELNPRHSMLNTRRILLVVSRDSVVSYKNGATPPATPAPAPTSPRTPLAMHQPFSGVQGFAVASDMFPLLSTTVEDHDDNSTTMEFANFKVNNRLSASDFSFMIPPGVQVVKPSERNQRR